MTPYDIKKYLNRTPETSKDYQQAYENYELEYWCNKLGVSKEKLKQAIANVGVGVNDVKSYLREHGLMA